MSQLSDALFTSTQQQVLGLLYAQPDKSFYTREIIRLTGMGVATIKRELDRMLAAGIISMTRIGNQHHYQASPECPIYQELLGITRKTFGIADVVHKALEHNADDIVCAFIYGSIAKATDTASSDIDVMVITDRLSYSEIVELLYPCDQKLGRSVNPVVFASEEFINKLSQDVAFVTRVMEQPKIMLIGSMDDIPKAR